MTTLQTALLGLAFLWILGIAWLGFWLDARLFFLPYRHHADPTSPSFYDDSRLDFPFYRRRRRILGQRLSDPFLERRRQIVRWLGPAPASPSLQSRSVHVTRDIHER